MTYFDVFFCVTCTLNGCYDLVINQLHVDIFQLLPHVIPNSMQALHALTIWKLTDMVLNMPVGSLRVVPK